MTITEFRYWSPILGTNVLRIGTWGNDGLERFAIVDCDVHGKERRLIRKRAIDALESAVEKNAPAGEVSIQ